MKTVNITVSLVLVVSLAGCAGMTDEQQRMVSGGAMGAAGGAVLGAVTGGSALIGAAIGERPALPGEPWSINSRKPRHQSRRKRKQPPQSQRTRRIDLTDPFSMEVRNGLRNPPRVSSFGESGSKPDRVLE